MRFCFCMRLCLILVVSLCSFVLIGSVLNFERASIHDHEDAQRDQILPLNERQEINKPFQSPQVALGNVILERRSFTTPRECRNYTTKLYELGTFGKTALVSYPGSGNTWLRHLIEMASGVFTGSVYFDENLYSRGFMGEKESWESGTTIVQKSHMKYSKEQNFGKAILLIRDPIASTKAFVQYMESGHTGWSLPTTFLHKDWPKYILNSVFKWVDLSKSWLESQIKLLVIHYEDLRTDPVSEITRICTFLEINCSRISSKCFISNIEGVFHRRKTVWKTKMLLTEKDLNFITQGILRLNSILKKFNHREIPFSKYESSRSKSFQFISNITRF